MSVRVLLILAGLAVMAWMAINEPIIPDAADCAARGQAADCWKDAR